MFCIHRLGLQPTRFLNKLDFKDKEEKTRKISALGIKPKILSFKYQPQPGFTAIKEMTLFSVCVLFKNQRNSLLRDLPFKALNAKFCCKISELLILQL